jgi:hypothetical protein
MLIVSQITAVIPFILLAKKLQLQLGILFIISNLVEEQYCGNQFSNKKN